MSVRFAVDRDLWTQPITPTRHNPQKLPERRLREVTLYELGPVVFPAYQTSVQVRGSSRTTRSTS
jgi:hypothetical protein